MRIHGCGLKLTADIGIDDISNSIEREDEGLDLEFHFSTIFRTPDGARLAMRLSSAAGPPSDPPELCDRAKAFLAECENERGLQSDTCDAAPIDHIRYFRCVRDVSRADLARRDLLLPLSRAMPDAPAAAASSGIPAPFTYLGQFIAHDVTHTVFDGDFANPENYRSQAFDLDSVFGAVRADFTPPADLPELGGLRLGPTAPSQQGYDDFPRDNTDKYRGVPCIPDLRNDNNLNVAQLTVAIMKFHWLLAQLYPSAPERELKAMTMRHVQSVVLNDFLPRIVDPNVYNDVRSPGRRDRRRVIFPKGLPRFFQVPVEFAAACFRFGHTLVRDKYSWNAVQDTALSGQLRLFSHLAGVYRYVPQLADSWIIDWDRFSHNQASMAIDTRIAEDLRRLDRDWIDDPDVTGPGAPLSLGHVTLLRGDSMKVPTAQLLRTYLAGHLPDDAPELVPLAADEILPRGADWVQRHLCDDDQVELRERTPLWYYILREATFRGAFGSHLGPMCSRIVMETIHAAIEAAPGNIISGTPFVTAARLPVQPAQREKFLFADMINNLCRLSVPN